MITTLTHRKIRTALAGSVGVACIAIVALAAVCSGADDVARLKRLVGPESQRADYIVVIDTSQSMRRYWQQIIAGVSEFAGSLPDNDHVSIVLFERDATNTRVLPRVINARTRFDLRSELSALPSPSGQKTDFGRALTLVVAEISRPSAHQLQFVFIFSDFEHDPPFDSQFRNADPSSTPWSELASRALLAMSNKTVQSFALLLPLSAVAGRDIATVRSVLGRLETVPVNNEETLRAWFSRRREEIERDKLRSVVREEISRGWAIDAQPTVLGTDLRVHSRLQRLPLSINVSSVNVQGYPARPASDKALPLLPGQSDAIATVRPADPWSWVKWLFSSPTPRRVEVELVGEVQVEPAGEIEPALQIAPRLALDASQRMSLDISYGSPLALKVGLLVLLFVVLYGAWRVWLAPAVDVGLLIHRITISGGIHGEELRVGEFRGAAVAIGNAGDCNLCSRLETPQFALRIISRKPRFLRLSPRRGLYAYRLSGSVYYLGQQYDNRTRKWSMQEIPLPQTPSEAVPVGFQTRLLVKGSGQQFDVRFGN